MRTEQSAAETWCLLLKCVSAILNPAASSFIFSLPILEPNLLSFVPPHLNYKNNAQPVKTLFFVFLIQKIRTIVPEHSYFNTL